MFDIRILITLGVGFCIFIMILTVFFSATQSVLNSVTITNTYLNDSLTTILQGSKTVFQNINTAWIIGAIAAVVIIVIALYRYFLG